MTQRASFHTGHFEYLDEAGQRQQTRSFWIEFVDENARSGSFSVFADSENTLNWLKERDLLPYEVLPNNGHG